MDPAIRFVGIWHHNELTHVSREGLISFLDEEETMSSVRGSVMRNQIRQGLNKKIGKPRFTITKYDQIYRITIPITPSDLLLVSTDLECDLLNVVNKITKFNEQIKKMGDGQELRMY